MDAQTSNRVRLSFLRACELDITVRKPGNVSTISPGHGMQANQFIASAAAAAGPLCQARARVGPRIEAAMRASWDAAQCNTNLGIVLLCAPLAAACEDAPPNDSAAALQRRLEGVLQGLDVDDARAAYRAIALARPGGLGRVAEQDVDEAPTVDLRAAMALAADRDRIAWQYVHAHADLFQRGLPAFEETLHHARRALDAPTAASQAMLRVYLEFLAALPDSHIVRKHGAAVAQCVMAEAMPWLLRAARGETVDDDPAFAHWDLSLKARGINPGTSADLAVACTFLAGVIGHNANGAPAR